MLQALFSVVIIGVIINAVFIPLPLDSPALVRIGVLIFIALGASGGLVWAWRTRPDTRPFARRELLDAIELAAVMIVDDGGIIRHWSRGCEELYGWPAMLAVGQKRDSLLQSHIDESVPQMWDHLFVEGRLDREVVERHRNGCELVVHDHIKLVDHGQSRYSAVIAVTDVTEWRNAEAELRLSEARLATSVAVQGIFIYEYDLVTARPIWTTSGETFFGGPTDEIAALPWRWGSEHSQQIQAAIDAAAAGHQDRTHYDFDFRYPDGTERRAEGWARIIRDAEGQPTRLLGTHLDVTERRERELALRAGEAERRAILDTVPDAMFVCNERGFVRACSVTACRLLGYSEAELIGTGLIDLVEDPRGREAVRQELIAGYNLGPDTSWPLPINIRRSTGELVPMSFVIGGAVIEGTRMHVVFGRDMRPTIAAEERFHRLNNDLAQVSRLGMMGEMAGALAHELSQPLSAIVNFLGAVDLMLEGGDPTDRQRLRHALQRASEQASRAGEIIRRLRAFILRGEADMRAERLASLIREAAALALFNTGSFGVRLTYDFENEQRLVLGDRIQIQQVLVNLIRNATDAMATQGSGRRELRISTVIARDNLVEIAVRDSGPGVAPEMIEKLFSPFATTKREGLGFGLAISRRIIEAHGGQLSAAAAADGGAIFRFTLPVMEDESG